MINIRAPYVGEGIDGARRSAEIDRTEADLHQVGSERHIELLASAVRWEEQADGMEAVACSFEGQDWDFVLEIDGPVLVCDRHGCPAGPGVYDHPPGEEVGLCAPQYESMLAHGSFYGENLIGRGASVDETRCYCGRPVDRCLRHLDARYMQALIADQKEALS